MAGDHRVPVRQPVGASGRLATTQAISQLTRVDRRLSALFWHLAERWGRVGGDGVVIPLALTHRILGQLVGRAEADRLHALCPSSRSANELVRRPDGSWLLRGRPPDARAGRATRARAGRARRSASPGTRFGREGSRRDRPLTGIMGGRDGSPVAVHPLAPTRRPHVHPHRSEGILSDASARKRDELIELLQKAYWMEIETVMSYIANSINPDGVRAQEIIESLQEDIQEELGHAQQFAARIKELYGVVPGSLDFQAEQTYLQPPEHQTDIVHVIKGVIEAETGAIEHYNRIIEFTDGVDYVTQDMVIAILHDEEGHRRLFEGYLREYEAEGLA
jgi:bacterioferritin